MITYLGYLVRGVEHINKAIEILCSLLLVLMIFLVVFQVIFRYLLGTPISWSEEVAIFMLIWFGMLSVATAVYRHEHISISVISDRLSKKGQYFLATLVQLLILVFALNIMLNSTLLMSLVGSEILPASGILRSYLYLAPLVAGALMVINAIANILWNADPNKHDDNQSPALDALSGTEK